MKILSLHYTNAFAHITNGWKNALLATGHQWGWMDGDKPAFDAFSEFEPDIFSGTTYDLDRATIKCIKERPNLIVVLKAQNWGPLDEVIQGGGSSPARIDGASAQEVNEARIKHEAKYPIGISNEKEQEMICTLREQVDNKIVLHNFYHEKRMPDTMGYWNDHGIDTIGMQPAADHFVHKPVHSVDFLQSDMSFIGGYWKYKGQNLDQYITPLCYPVGKYNIKIFGNQLWPVPQYMGPIEEYLVNHVFCSSKICLNVSEPHANEFGFEVNERVFKLAACKCFCISDYIASLVEDIFVDGEMPTAKTPEEFHEKIEFYLDNPELREEHADKCYNTVMKSHTYCHRIANLLNKVGLDDEAGKCLEIIDRRNQTNA